MGISLILIGILALVVSWRMDIIEERIAQLENKHYQLKTFRIKRKVSKRVLSPHY